MKFPVEDIEGHQFDEESSEEVSKAIDALKENPDLINQVYQKIIDRISRETGFLKHLLPYDILNKIHQEKPSFPGVSNIIYGKTDFIRNTIQSISFRIGKLLNNMPGGQFVFPDRDINVSRDAPTLLTTIEFLTNGKLPTQANALIHELIHSMQYINTGNKNLDMRLSNMYHDHPVVLREVQAFLFNPNFLTDPEITELLLNYYNFDSDQIIIALELIHSLEALNLPMEEIGQLLIYFDKWDKKTKDYSDLRAQVEKYREAAQLSPDELKQKIVEFQHNKLQEKEMVAKIAQEELFNSIS